MEKEIAFKENTITKENLPFSIVLYPGHYGAFFAFKESDNSKPYFCSCAFEAIENYICIRQLQPKYLNSDPRRMYILDPHNFPSSIVEDLMSEEVSEHDVMNHLHFGEKLCHECNLQTPSYRYCHEMYGGAFKQNYGWYIAKQGFEWGFDRHDTKSLIQEASPDDLLMLIEDEEFSEIRERMDLLMEKIQSLENRWTNLNEKEKEELGAFFRERNELSKRFSKHHRKINNVIENVVREKFGHKKVGEAWTSETILYYIIKKLFSEYTVHRHYRPDFMEGLELDIYIEELRIGIEYQGIQHYKPIKHWCGEESLIGLKKRDEKKRYICENLGIPLIYFEYNEGLSDDLVRQKLSKYCK
jgi:tetrahydromethanopterin S-methyltransferase subunit G